MRTSIVSVMTTIQPPTQAMHGLAEHLHECGGKFIVVGDKPGPYSYEIEGVTFIPFEAQSTLPYRLARTLRPNSYARKNLGYLLAVSQGACALYDTDDDNAPTDKWAPRELVVHAESAVGERWANIYELFADTMIWPRGLPLQYVRRASPAVTSPEVVVTAPIQQVLVNTAPDVDAVWRLIHETNVTFKQRRSVHVVPHSWCPFNSQATWWWPDAYPLLYIPTFCHARVADIWRSLIAQRCLWEMGLGVVFHSPDVEHDRNLHDPMRDFEDEIVGYLQNAEITNILERLRLSPGTSAALQNLRYCYSALISTGVLPEAEGSLVDDWIEDFTQATPQRCPAGQGG